MKNLITMVLLVFAAFTSTSNSQSAWFTTGNFDVYVGQYGNIIISTIVGEDTLSHFDRASILVSGAENQVFDYFADVEVIGETTLLPGNSDADYIINGLYDNSYSGLPPAVELDQTVYGWQNKRYVVVKLDITNMESGTLSSSIGLDIVADVDYTYEDDSLRFNPANNVLYMYDTTYVGFKILNAETKTAYAFEWYDGYRDSDTLLYNYLTSGIKDSVLLGTDADGAVAIIGTTPYTLNANDSVEVYIAIALGDDETEMLANIAEAETKLNDITSVTRRDLLPKTFSLSQNYPNPFNPATKISFDLPSNETVSLKVFNMLGEEVATLINQEMEAGNYTVDFNASSLSSGMYIYQLNAGNFQQTKKMTLIK